MKIPREYEDARLNLRRTAELLTMHEGHLRRLVRRGATRTGPSALDRGSVAPALRVGRFEAAGQASRDGAAGPMG